MCIPSIPCGSPGVFSFDCTSRFGKAVDGNAQRVPAVTLTINREGGAFEKVKVVVFTEAAKSSATAGTHYDAIEGQEVVFDAGETTKTVSLGLKGLSAGETSKVVRVALKNAAFADPKAASNPPTIDLLKSTAQVTLYASKQTAKIINDVEQAMCRNIAPAAASTATKYTQTEYDQTIIGIRDLLGQARQAVSARRFRRAQGMTVNDYLKTAGALLQAILDPNNILTEGDGRVTLFRSVGSLLHEYASIKVATRANPNDAANCPSRLPLFDQPAFSLTVATAKAASISQGVITDVSNPAQPYVDGKMTAPAYEIKLPALSALRNASCTAVTHFDFSNSLYFPVAGFKVKDDADADVFLPEMKVMASQVVSAKLDGSATSSWTKSQVDYTVRYSNSAEEIKDDYSAGQRYCVWWDLERSRWNNNGCTEEATPRADSLVGTDGVRCTCKMSAVEGGHTFAVLVPVQQPVEVVAIASAYSIAMFIKAAAIMFVLVQVGQDGESEHLKLGIHFFIVIFLTAVVSAISSLLSSEVSGMECTGPH